MELIKAVKIYNLITKSALDHYLIDCIRAVVFFCGMEPNQNRIRTIKKIRENFETEAYKNNLSKDDVDDLIARQDQYDKLQGRLFHAMYREDDKKVQFDMLQEILKDAFRA
jgi:hypothetical protein